MDLLWMMLLMVLVHSEAQNVMEVRGELGRDVTLNCSFNYHDIYWFMEIHKDRAQIGRTFSSSSSVYSSPDFETKYSMMENRLVIRNVSAEDSRLYFCGRKRNGTIVYGDTIHLISHVLVTPPSTTVTSSLTDGPEKLLENPVVVTSLTLSAVVLLVLGVTCVCFGKKICCRVKNHQEPIRENLEMQTPQYKIHLPLLQVSSDCIYSKALCHMPPTNRLTWTVGLYRVP